jgi:UDP-4-amino-4,6-dideoxy-L-N-acetyl-beta-L-altrosamine transaminase
MSFIPYGKQFIDEDDLKAVEETLKSDFLTTGPKVREFEEALAKKCNSKYSVVVSNGTAALHLASLALLEKGDKVLTTPNSFLATSNAILYANATPVFVDIMLFMRNCSLVLGRERFAKSTLVVSFAPPRAANSENAPV